ncbi:MAG: hypothetical protein KDD53_01250 [Bdellovibrionales bacterium]|nr:hypothetical protein [Bdellovibrionales bacterium]
MTRTICFLFVIVLMSACGRYDVPLYPESLAPEAVKKLQVVGELQGVRFSWEASDVDRRGKPLKTLSGYKVMRKEVNKESDIADKEIEYELVELVEDGHIEELKKAQELAKQEGRLSRKVDVDPTLKEFEFLDLTVSPGVRYVYKLVPVNQGGDAKGEVDTLVDVRFRGEASEIKLITQETLDEYGNKSAS